MVEPGEQVFDFCLGNAVIKRGGQVKQKHGCSEYGKTYYVPGIAFFYCKNSQYYQAGKAQQCPNSVSNAVENFFSYRECSVVWLFICVFCHLFFLYEISNSFKFWSKLEIFAGTLKESK